MVLFEQLIAVEGRPMMGKTGAVLNCIRSRQTGWRFWNRLTASGQLRLILRFKTEVKVLDCIGSLI